MEQPNPPEYEAYQPTTNDQPRGGGAAYTRPPPPPANSTPYPPPSTSYAPPPDRSYQSTPPIGSSYQPGPPPVGPSYGPPAGLPPQQAGAAANSYDPAFFRLYLLNPQDVSSGFSMSPPAAIRSLPQSDQAVATWTDFMRELNQVLSKFPGTVVREIAEFWLFNLVTLGMATHAQNMYKSKIKSRAARLIECYNRAQFANLGIRGHLDVVQVGNGSNRRRQQQQQQQGPFQSHSGSDDDDDYTMVLVFERS